ncbi:RapZ C-terminal domain-containing protein [Actinokineospora auranticolor]|uniref:RapZ C-terminal domain-containing protein n=1 Tax=Actinokineospora auranticolor TaxID=155976 RepID=UPI0015E2B9F7
MSFGFLHGPAPEADVVVDLRRYLRDPARMSADLLDLDGRDLAVMQVVLDTPGALATVHEVVALVEAAPRMTSVALGCAGGRHRSVALALCVGWGLRGKGLDVDVTHRHVHLPRVLTNGEGQSR